MSDGSAAFPASTALRSLAIGHGNLTLRTQHRLAQLKDYRSLMPMAQEASKPMFLLKPADGAIGGHQQAVTDCYQDFRRLAQIILERAAPAAAAR